MGAKVDGKIVSLDYKLHTGDIVEILTTKDESRGPNRAWLEIVQTNEAKSKIRSWFKKECKDENIQQGKQELEREFQHYHMHVPEDQMEAFLGDDLKRHNCSTLDDFYASIGYGGVLVPKIMQRLKDNYIKTYGEATDEIVSIKRPKKKKGDSGIIFEDKFTDFQVRFSQCCNPLPGDDIVGFITRGHGVSVHKKTCPNYLSSIANEENADRWKKVEWSKSQKNDFHAVIEVIAIDRNGLLQQVSTVISEARIPIFNSTSRRLKNGNAVIKATIAVSGKEQLSTLVEKLQKIHDVISVTRLESRRGLW